ncbi:MAG: hypothetical protein RLZ98_882 [Pseudomonadota bacterium]
MTETNFSPPIADVAGATAGAGLAMVTSGVVVMASMMEFWSRTLSGHSGVVADSSRRAAEKQEAKSWYRHPDGAYAAGPDSIRAGWPWVGPALAAMPMATAFWMPLMVAGASRFQPSVAGMIEAAANPISSAAADLMSPFVAYRSAGGHAVAQIVFDPAGSSRAFSDWSKAAAPEGAVGLADAWLRMWRLV